MIAPKEKYVRLVGIPVLAVIMMHFIKEHQEEDPLWYKYLVTLIFTAVYWNGAFAIFMIYRKYFPDIKGTMKRLGLTIISLMLWVFLAGTILRICFGFQSVDSAFNLEVFLEHKFTTLIACIFVGSIYESAYFFEKWKDSIRQNEALKNQQVRTQFEVLQNQMSPHFLFNSLNTLTTLIAENQNTAVEFTENLSEVYRYILKSKELELTSVASEIAFAKSYMYLLQMRYPENLQVDFNIGMEAIEKHIAPLTIQMLLENCIKHNVISRSQPLFVEVYSDNNDSILVKNNLQRKKTLEKSTKTGLENIKKRYQYLSKKEVTVITTHQNFIVAVPLIELVDQKATLVKAV